MQAMASPAVGHWGTCKSVKVNLDLLHFFQCTLTYTKSDSDYMSTVASCNLVCKLMVANARPRMANHP